MLAKFLFTTVPGSILFAAIIISISILVGSGNLRISASASQKDIGTAKQVACQTIQKP